jgi:hypothetical protein
VTGPQADWTTPVPKKRKGGKKKKEKKKVKKYKPLVVSGAAPAGVTAEFQGAGVSKITTDKGSAYLIRQPVPETFTHKTGPSVAPGAEVKRTLCIFNGRFPGDPTMSERELLDKESYLSHLYHYRDDNQGVARDAPLAERKTKYIKQDAQVRAENLIDTESKAVPEIPHGPLSPANFKRLQKEVKGLRRDGVVVFTDIESDWEEETPENKRNLKEAHENFLKCPWLMRAKLNRLSKFEKKKRDQSDAGKPFLRDKWNKIARAHLADLGVAGAEFFEVHSVHLVDDVAGRYHIDLLGLGPSALVVVLEADEPYHVLFAAVKQGDLPQDAARPYGDDDDDETAAVPPPGNADVYICITWA